MPNENLIICAHHDYEWFIAKPINRLGGPGLVPVSYVKIIDLLNPNSHYTSIDTSRRSQVIQVINGFNIPTVEQSPLVQYQEVVLHQHQLIHNILIIIL